MKYDEKGREIPDQTPVEVPLGFRRPPTMAEMIAAAVRSQAFRDRVGRDTETYDEANDFDVEDDMFPASAHEYDEDDEVRERAAIEAAQADLAAELKEKAAGKPEDKPKGESPDSKDS